MHMSLKRGCLIIKQVTRAEVITIAPFLFMALVLCIKKMCIQKSESFNKYCVCFA